MFFSIKYKENQEKNIKLFGSIKEKCYFCKRVEILASQELWNLSTPCSLYIKRCRKELGNLSTDKLLNIKRRSEARKEQK